MKIAIYGTGPIGSTFAFHMSTAGHEVTCIARGARLARLRAEGAIVMVDGRRAPITVAEALDPAVAFELVIVTVLAHRVAASGIAAGVERDMQSWLRTHAVGVVVMMSLAATAYQRGAGLSFAKARTYARALREGFGLIVQLGDRLRPSALKLLGVLPVAAVAAIFFVTSRTGLVKTIGAIGADEPRALLDDMLTAASAPMPSLRAIRP
jgi:hypothetical protein